MIRVLIADDNEDQRNLLGLIIDGAEDMALVGSAEDATQAVTLAGEVEPDVAVLDWMMPGGGGGEAAKQILTHNPDVRILAWTAGELVGASYDMLGSGARDILAKGSSKEQVLSAIRSVVRW